MKIKRTKHLQWFIFFVMNNWYIFPRKLFIYTGSIKNTWLQFPVKVNILSFSWIVLYNIASCIKIYSFLFRNKRRSWSYMGKVEIIYSDNVDILLFLSGKFTLGGWDKALLPSIWNGWVRAPHLAIIQSAWNSHSVWARLSQCIKLFLEVSRKPCLWAVTLSRLPDPLYWLLLNIWRFTLARDSLKAQCGFQNSPVIF